MSIYGVSISMSNKICLHCKQKKPIQDFNTYLYRGQHRYRNRCKSCTNKKAKEFRLNNPDYNKIKSRAYQIKNPARILWLQARRRAKENQLEFNIEISDIIIPNKCPILHLPISIGLEGRQPTAASLDRIDNSKGYVKGNVAVISRRANELKSDGSLEDFKNLIEYLEKNLKKS